MFTQCPECDAIFQLSASQLKAANGDVRCGQCLSIFSALDHLSEDVPHAQETDNTDDMAHDADPYRDESDGTTESTEASDDIFSDVIAEVHAGDVPKEEIDRFEEFLAADASPAEDPTTPAKDVLLTKNTTAVTDEAIITTDDTNFGDVDSVTVDLKAKANVNDDEFAELDAYLHSTEDEYPDNVARPANKVETADFNPGTSSSHADAVSEPVADANTTKAPETINIPTLILDDLHAAKAEQMRPSSTPWIVGSLVLMLMLVLQVIYHSRDDLAKDAKLRPWLIQMCNMTNCTLNQAYDVKQIEIIGRDVRSHPTAHKALVVSTTLINNADFVQPFPLLTMVFSDINGTKIAQRRFAPREYLHNNVDRDAGMTPDMPVRIDLELVDPGKAAVNYEFRAEVDPRRTRPLS